MGYFGAGRGGKCHVNRRPANAFALRCRLDPHRDGFVPFSCGGIPEMNSRSLTVRVSSASRVPHAKKMIPSCAGRYFLQAARRCWTDAALDRIEDPFPEILRIGCHWSPPYRDRHFKWDAIQLYGALEVVPTVTLVANSCRGSPGRSLGTMGPPGKGIPGFLTRQPNSPPVSTVVSPGAIWVR